MPGLANVDVLHERLFRLLFTANAVSLLGDGFARVALVFAVLEVSDSPASVGVVLAAQSVPLVALLLVGGVVGDRRSRRSIMVAADVARLVSQAVMAALLVGGVAQVWQLAVLAGAHGAATAFFNPAATALMPQTVGPHHLRQANALRGMAQAAGGLLGPAIGGVVVAVAGAGWALGIDAVSFGISGLVLLRLPRVVPPARTEQDAFVRELREGWQEFTRRGWVWGIVAGAALGNLLLGALWVIGPVVADRSLGGPAAWGVIVSGLGAGSLLGGMAVLRVRPRRPLVVAVVAAALPAGAMALVAAAAPVPVLVVAMLLAGAGLMAFNTLWDTALQRHVPPASLSRVSAYDWCGSLALDPVGRGLAGPVAATIGLSTTLWAAAIAYACVSAGELAIPGVRQLDDDVRSQPHHP